MTATNTVMNLDRLRRLGVCLSRITLYEYCSIPIFVFGKDDTDEEYSTIFVMILYNDNVPERKCAFATSLKESLESEVASVPELLHLVKITMRPDLNQDETTVYNETDRKYFHVTYDMEPLLWTYTPQMAYICFE